MKVFVFLFFTNVFGGVPENGYSVKLKFTDKVVIRGGMQRVRIKGVVTDQKGLPLPGASIVEKGTNNATQTDFDGVFSLVISSKNAVISVSYIGFLNQEIQINGNDNILIKLVESASKLEEVVVVGYGTTKKTDLTGSVSTISKEDLGDRSITSLDAAMKGKAAGLQIIQNDGAPGAESTIRIRGASSINASSAPLYVIDGMISDNGSLDVAPGDVASIQILKDASATAIYGSRGSNGVIIITTKSGKAGKTKIDFYSASGIQTSTRLYDMMDTEQWARAKFQSSLAYFKNTQVTQAMLNDPNYIYYKDGTGTDANYWRTTSDNPYANSQVYKDSVNTNWQKVMIRQPLMNEYRLNVSGGNDKSKFAVMGNYLKQDGLIINSGYKRYGFRFNWQQDLSDKVTLNTNISLTKSKYDGISTGTSDGVTTAMLRQLPITPFTENDVAEQDNADQYISTNPYYNANNIIMDRFRDSYIYRAGLDYKISKPLMLRTTITDVLIKNSDETFYPVTTAQGFKQGGRAIINNSTGDHITNENLLYFTPTLAKRNSLKIMAGAIIEHYGSSNLRVENWAFPSINLGVDAIGLGTSPQVPISSKISWNMLSYLSRLEYSYNKKYLFTATMRADGSSRFAKSNKWGYFPSAAIAWKASEESFVKDLEIFSNLKFRASAGKSGNTAISPYQSLSTINTSFYPMSGNDNINYGVSIDQAANKDLKWETTTQYDLGLDIGLFNNRVNLTAEAYLKETNDLLLRKSVPRYSGFTTTWSNIGSIQNKGLEFTVDADIIDNNKFTWNTQFNIGFNRSKVIDLGEADEMFFDPGVISGSGNFVILRKGEAVGQWYGYQVDGVWRSQAEIDNSPINSVFSTTKANLRPGDHKFIDTNGDGVISSEDRTKLGNGSPLFSGGFTNSFSYKGFSLNIFFQYSYGAKVFNANLATLDAGRENYNMTTHLVNSWSPTLYTLDGQLYDQGNPNGKYRLPGGVAENYALSEFIVDGSFIRLSDVTLSYTLAKEITDKMHIGGLRFFASANNLHVWTKYFGYDPEVNTRQGATGDLMPSLDYSSYPRTTTYTFGFNINL